MLFVVKTVTIPRASRGHSSNFEVNVEHVGFRLVLPLMRVEASAAASGLFRGTRFRLLSVVAPGSQGRLR